MRTLVADLRSNRKSKESGLENAETWDCDLDLNPDWELQTAIMSVRTVGPCSRSKSLSIDRNSASVCSVRVIFVRVTVPFELFVPRKT